MAAVANAERARNVANCRSGQSSCEVWKLTETEAIALPVAAYDRKVSNSRGGFQPCDPSWLTPSEITASNPERRCQGVASVELGATTTPVGEKRPATVAQVS